MNSFAAQPAHHNLAITLQPHVLTHMDEFTKLLLLTLTVSYAPMLEVHPLTLDFAEE